MRTLLSLSCQKPKVFEEENPTKSRNPNSARMKARSCDSTSGCGEMAYAHGLGPCGVTRGGSTPLIRTKEQSEEMMKCRGEKELKKVRTRRSCSAKQNERYGHKPHQIDPSLIPSTTCQDAKTYE